MKEKLRKLIKKLLRTKDAGYFIDKFSLIEEFGKGGIDQKCVLYYCGGYRGREAKALSKILSKTLGGVPCSMETDIVFMLNDGGFSWDMYGETPKERIMKVLEIALQKGL